MAVCPGPQSGVVPGSVSWGHGEDCGTEGLDHGLLSGVVDSRELDRGLLGGVFSSRELDRGLLGGVSNSREMDRGLLGEEFNNRGLDRKLLGERPDLEYEITRAGVG